MDDQYPSKGDDWFELFTNDGAFVSVDTNDILTNNEFPILDVGRKIISEDNGNALTWWNSHVKTITHEVAYAMTWKTLKKMMNDKYFPRGEIKKLEIEMMFPKESDEINKYIGGLSDMIYGSVMASKPKTMQVAIEFSTELMDQKIHTLAERQAKNKRKFEDTSRNNQNQQQPFKRHNVARAYTTGPGEKQPYRGSKPLCPK
ncbi:reverse transcriptase domain-containing protein [Tanacetum coccineum]